MSKITLAETYKLEKNNKHLHVFNKTRAEISHI